MTQPVLWPDQVGGTDGAEATGLGTHDGAPGLPPGSRDGRVRRVLRTAVVVAAVGVLAAQVVWIAGLVRSVESVRDPVGTSEVPFADEAVEAPPVAAGGPGAAARPVVRSAVRRWADGLSPRVGIPAVALAAYGQAELRLAREQPGCHLSWVALAGIGRIESDHGRYGGAVLGEDGRSNPPIVGVPLDGNGVATIRDTDGGAFDGDTVHDRAVGPMQFIPSTWRRWGADADGDGVADPNVLPDAALAAGRYLCSAAGGDLRTGRAWTRAVLAYNNSGDYLARVTAASNGYAEASTRR